jgi:hypothetical protein
VVVEAGIILPFEEVGWHVARSSSCEDLLAEWLVGVGGDLVLEDPESFVLRRWVACERYLVKSELGGSLDAYSEVNECTFERSQTSIDQPVDIPNDM